ncbi:MAG: NYN domain-containing protein [Chloroflexota bacterium]|jgi:predicted RNA-binding protein with PIN domain
MNYLIDGHNLIGSMPNISLSDDNDEFKLVFLLRKIAVSKKNRQILVVFDRGVYGHQQSLNGYGVTCHFALSPEDADTQIIRRIKGLRTPKEWALVTADRRIIDVAHQYGVRHMPNQLFVSQLLRKESPKADIHEEKPEVPLSALQIEQWRVELNLPAEVSDEQLLLQESMRDLSPKKRKK